MRPCTQVRTCQRLGYMNVFNPRRPAMHYRLRMFKVRGKDLRNNEMLCKNTLKTMKCKGGGFKK